MQCLQRFYKDIFWIFFNMKVFCVFSLEMPQQGDSNEYTQYTIPQYKKRKSSYIILSLHLWDLFQGTLEGVRNSHGKQAISVRAIEVLLYVLVHSLLF